MSRHDKLRTFPDIGSLADFMNAARTVGDEELRAQYNPMYERSQFHGYGWGTHIPLLASVVATARPGPVLEIGVGRCSSPVLVEMCKATGRPLFGLDSSVAWLDEIAEIGYPNLQHVADWRDMPGWLRTAESWPLFADTYHQGWSVILIDHGPAEARLPVLQACKGHAEFIVCHDTLNPNYLPGYEEELNSYKYRTDYTLMTANTSVVSDVRPYAGAR